MALRISASGAACAMVGLALVGNMLKGTGDGGGGTPSKPAAVAAKVATAAPHAEPLPATAASAPAGEARVAAAGAPSGPATTAGGGVFAAAPPAAGIDDSLPTGSIDPGSGLHRPNPAAYGDAAKHGSSLVIGGAEAINYLAGNTLKRQTGSEAPHYVYFASRGVMAEGTDRGFVARAWDRNRADLCAAGPDGATSCRPVEILLDAKEELQGGRLGTVTIGGETAELIKGNVLHVPQHIPFLDSAVSLDAAAAPKAVDGMSGLLDRAAAVTSEAGAGRRFTVYGADNKLLDILPIEAGPDGGRAVKVTVGHWRLAKATVCETHAAEGSGQACYKPQPAADGTVRLLPVAKGGQALRVEPLPETPVRDLAED